MSQDTVLYFHGTHKFTGLEDDAERDGAVEQAYFSILNKEFQPSCVRFGHKANGKNGLVAFFELRGKTYILITSKNVPRIVLLDMLEQPNPFGIDEEIHRGIFAGLQECRSAMKSDEWNAFVQTNICRKRSLMLELQDGKHIVPIQYERAGRTLEFIVFTAAIDANQTGDFSLSHSVPYDEAFPDNVNPKIHRNESHTIPFTTQKDILNEIQERCKFGVNKEGYVIEFIQEKDGKIQTRRLKAKTAWYVLLRALRQWLQKDAFRRCRLSDLFVQKNSFLHLPQDVLHRAIQYCETLACVIEIQAKDSHSCIASYLTFSGTTSVGMGTAVLRAESHIGMAFSTVFENTEIEDVTFLNRLNKHVKRLKHPASVSIPSFIDANVNSALCTKLREAGFCDVPVLSLIHI